MLKQKYLSKPSAIATYDYTDVASGTGYSVFYGGTVNTSGSYVLADNSYYSNTVTTWRVATATMTKLIDADFDVQINRPLIVDGDFIVSLSLGIGRKTPAAPGYTTTANLSGAIILDDGSENVLGTFTSTNLVAVDASEPFKTKVMTMSTPVSLTQFKSGNILRVTIEGWAKVDSAYEAYVGIGHDAKNRNDPEAVRKTIYDESTSSYGPTIMEVHVPFKVDV